MTTVNLFWAFVGFILCAIIFSVVCIMIMSVIWWVFKTNQDIEINSNEWEDEYEQEEL